MPNKTNAFLQDLAERDVTLAEMRRNGLNIINKSSATRPDYTLRNIAITRPTEPSLIEHIGATVSYEFNRFLRNCGITVNRSDTTSQIGVADLYDENGILVHAGEIIRSSRRSFGKNRKATETVMKKRQSQLVAG